MSYLDDAGNLRANPGGEVGVNGEFYLGGQFIATHEGRVKGADPRREATPAQIAYAKEHARVREEERATREDRAKANVPVLLVLFGEEFKQTIWGIIKSHSLRYNHSDGFSGTDFWFDHVASLLNGRNPSKWSSRRLEIFLEMHGKRFGRKGSKAYKRNYSDLKNAIIELEY